jgi:hypothetical protein
MSTKIWTALIAIVFVAVAGSYYFVAVQRSTVRSDVVPATPPSVAAAASSDEEIKRQTIEGIGSVDKLSKVDLNAASSKKRTP